MFGEKGDEEHELVHSIIGIQGKLIKYGHINTFMLPYKRSYPKYQCHKATCKNSHCKK